MKKGTTPGGSYWPDPLQEKLLRACFLPGERAAAEFQSWRAQTDLDRVDHSSLRLLPLLVFRWDGHELDPDTAALGQRVRLTNWGQNKLRLAVAASLLDTLDRAGIECLLLKGMAILDPYYADTGLRAMGDVDVLVHEQDAQAAVNALLDADWHPEAGLPFKEILDQMRVRHACQFVRGDAAHHQRVCGEQDGVEREDCDLHWRPLVRCFSPVVTAHFWNHADAVSICGRRARVPSATEQLFHTCAHGLQWDWTPSLRWVADALTILQSPAVIDWDRLVELGHAANMTVRVHAAMIYLRTRIEAPVPQAALEALASERPPRWEEHEHTLLQKPCPLGLLDSLRWHVYHFRRIRRFDPEWSRRNVASGFVEYLASFLNARNRRGFAAGLWRQLRIRLVAR